MEYTCFTGAPVLLEGKSEAKCFLPSKFPSEAQCFNFELGLILTELNNNNCLLQCLTCLNFVGFVCLTNK